MELNSDHDKNNHYSDINFKNIMKENLTVFRIMISQTARPEQ